MCVKNKVNMSNIQGDETSLLFGGKINIFTTFDHTVTLNEEQGH